MKFIRVIKAEAIKPNIDNYNFKDYQNPDAFLYGEMPERGTYRKALKSVVDEIEHQFNIVKKHYSGNMPAAKQFEIKLRNIWRHITVRDTLSTTDSSVRKQPELLQCVKDVRKYGYDLLEELKPLTQWNGNEWVKP